MGEGEIKFTARVDTSKMAGDLSKGVSGAQREFSRSSGLATSVPNLNSVSNQEQRRRAQMQIAERDAAFWAMHPPPMIRGGRSGGGGGGGGLSQGISAMGAAGIPGASTLARASIAGPAGAIGAAIAIQIIALRHVISRLSDAIHSAGALYAKQLQSGGLPGGFVSGRSVLARVIGVGEQEVLQYGNAVAYLNDKVAFASRTFAETNRTLTAVDWQLKITKENLSAMWSKLAVEAAPAIIEFAEAVSFVTKKVAENSRLLYALAQLSFANPSGAIATILGRNQLKEVQMAPAVGASSARLQTSAWEKMGLVLGNNASDNPLKSIAQYTKETVAELRKMAKDNMANGNSSQSTAFGTP